MLSEETEGMVEPQEQEVHDELFEQDEMAGMEQM